MSSLFSPLKIDKIFSQLFQRLHVWEIFGKCLGNISCNVMFLKLKCDLMKALAREVLFNNHFW